MPQCSDELLERSQQSPAFGMVYSSGFGGASLLPPLGRGDCYADALRRPVAFDVPMGGVAGGMSPTQNDRNR